ncbi:hypothetical protein PUNSTDRAFT_74324 [Punctularia strigosozonata HHB-11173 SS5]|uniref:uncharacterized protein n=1 Tax=Punctularia strigosozonata (strain HHB-11173) TaxID=741275 RepID=UPI000441759D|nr:uncharacterized protein PUNSTDRAFT_74324 [Punctularia strigosozonata HHB-11173 SS5]EIN05466.1 hypothetical protein PUNSTDRAFT_74324 [Punctularia strigosozonata HHB-11173 SS5]
MSAILRSSFAASGSFSPRSLSSIPPAAQNYEPLVKAVLRHRLTRHVFLHSALCSLVASAIWLSWLKTGLRPVITGGWVAYIPESSTLLLAALTWAGGVLPLIIFRRWSLTAAASIAPSPSQTVRNALAKPTTLYGFATYTASSACIFLLHIIAAKLAQDNDPQLSVFVKSKKHPYYLNGRFLYTLLFSVYLGAAFLLRNLMLDRFALRSKASPSFVFLAGILALKAAVFTLIAAATYAFIFALSRAFVIPIVLRIPLLGQFLRPFLGYVISRRSEWTFVLPLRNLGLLFRTSALGFSTVVLWEVAETLFDDIVAEPITVYQLTADPALALVSGITSTDPAGYFRRFAYAELQQLAQDDSTAASAKRTALFADQKYNPSMWAVLCRESLLLLGRDYQHLLRRGKPPLPPPAAPPAAKSVAPRAPGTPLKKGPIFKSTQESPIRKVVESLASDGTMSQAVEETEQNLHLPDLFRSVRSSELVKGPADSFAVVKEKVETVKVPDVRSVVTTAKGKGKEVLRSNVPAWAVELGDEVYDWWARDRASKLVERSLPNRELDAIVVEVLSYLVCASLKEDRYGVVQRDIPRILEAFVSLLTAIEEYHAEITKTYAPPALSPEEEAALPLNQLRERDAQAQEVAKASEHMAVVSDALKDGLLRVVRTFGEKLSAFKFPPRIARKLQGFADYS